MIRWYRQEAGREVFIVCVDEEKATLQDYREEKLTKPVPLDSRDLGGWARAAAGGLYGVTEIDDPRASHVAVGLIEIRRTPQG